MKTIPNILTPTGATLVTGAPMSFQQHIAREIAAAFTSNGGHIIYVCNDPNDGVAAVKAMGAWEKHHQRKSPSPQLTVIGLHNIRDVQVLANQINAQFADGESAGPRLVLRDTSRSLAVGEDVWPQWLPLLGKMTSAQYLSVQHVGIRGAAVTENKRPYTASWFISDDHPAPPAQRYGERYRLTNVATGEYHQLQSANAPGEIFFGLYEPEKAIA